MSEQEQDEYISVHTESVKAEDGPTYTKSYGCLVSNVAHYVLADPERERLRDEVIDAARDSENSYDDGIPSLVVSRALQALEAYEAKKGGG